MKIIPLKEIKDLFPLETLVRYRMELHYPYFEYESALLIEEDCEIENLNLDLVSDAFSIVEKGQYINTILCLKNCKAKNIFNENDNDSCGLIVLGNLNCENMVVGGQDIFIQGDLTVEECFWGHYNHGNLTVKGKTKAKVFIATEEYHYDEHKTNFDVIQTITDFDSEENDEEISKDKLIAIFDENVLYNFDEVFYDDEIFSWANWIDRDKCIEAVKIGKSILKKDIKPFVKPVIHYEKLFTIPSQISTQSDWDSQIPNFLKLAEIAALETDNVLEFSKYIWNYTVTKKAVNYPNVMTVVAKSDDFTVSVSLETTSKKSLFKTKTSHDVYAYVKKSGDEAGVFIFDETAPEEFYEALNEAWHILLYHAERGIHFYKRFIKEVSAQEIHQFCTLPIVTEFYNDWDDGDKNGFYHGKTKYAFHIPKEETGSAQLRITKEIKSHDDNYDCRGFRFDNDLVENPQKVELLYNFSQKETIEGRYKSYSGTKVYFFDDELYEEALNWYQKAKIHIAKENAEYIANPERYE